MFGVKKNYTERDFSVFVEGLGTSFCCGLASAYETFWSDNSKTEKTYYFHVIGFLRFLAEDASQAELRNFLKTDEISNPSDSYVVVLFHNLMSAYRRHLVSSDTDNRTKNNYVAGVRAFVRHLANCGLFPHGLSIKGFKYEKEVGSTLLDVTFHGEIDIEALIDNHKEILLSEGLDELDDIKCLLSNIFDEAASSDAFAGDGFDIVEASARVLNDRLQSLEKTSAKLIVEHYALLQGFKQWMADEAYIERATQLKFVSEQHVGQSRYLGAEYLRLLDKCALQVLAVYCHLYHGGVFPSDDHPASAFLRGRLTNSGLHVSDLRRVLGYSSKARVAAFVWLSIKHAFNPDSLLNLTTDCLVSVGEEGQYQLVWNKPRKGINNQESVVVKARRHGVELSVDTLTSVDVVEYLKDSTAYIRSFARQEDRHRLFIGYYKNFTKGADGKRVFVPSLLVLNTLNKSFKKLCLENTDSRWSSTLKALRGSVLLLTGLITKDVIQVMQVGRHSDLTMATKYTYHLPEILRREKTIRDFLDWFETVLTVNINQFAEKIGIDLESYDRRKQKIINQQFGGIHCADPTAGVQSGTKSGEVCHRVDKCISCDNRRSLFLSTKENIASVIHWRDALMEAEKALGEEAFSKWSLWMLFVNSILDRLYNAREHRRLLAQAEEFCKENQNPYIGLIPVRVVEEASA